jgi:hypothetical protein
MATSGWSDDKSYFVSQEEADKKFEEALEALRDSKGPAPVAHADFAGPPRNNAERIAKIKKDFENPNDVIEFGEKPPPPPNGLFKAAEKGGFVKKANKNGNRKGGKGKKGKKGKKRR